MQYCAGRSIKITVYLIFMGAMQFWRMSTIRTHEKNFLSLLNAHTKSGVESVSSMLKIKFREEETTTPLQAICPWVDFITNDLVLNKDGSIMAAFEYRGIDPDNLFDERVDTA